VIGPASRKLRRLAPLNLRIERLQRRLDIPAIERRVRSPQRGDHLLGAPARSKTLLVWMFVLFICGLTAVALAPLF